MRRKLLFSHAQFHGSYENVKLTLSFQEVNLKSIFGSKCPKMVNWGPGTINRILFFLMLFYECQFY